MTAETAMRQAAHTAEYYYERAVEYIMPSYPEESREEIMEKHQVAIAAFMAASAMDYAANAKFID